MKNSDISETKSNEPHEHKQFQDKNSESLKKTTDKKPEHHKAHAQIFVDGLSILRFNPVDKQTEIYFVKDHHKPIEINVFKTGCTEVWSSPPIPAKAQIEIRKSAPKDEGVCYEDPSVKDDEDFSWMPDLCKWYEVDKISFRENAKEHLSAKLVLKDVIFYTKLKSKNEAIREDLTSRQEHKEKIGRVLGGNIICEEGDTDIVISITGMRDKSFPKDEGPYFITIRAKPEEPMHDHFHVIYDYIIEIPAGKPKYSIRYKPREEEWELCPPKSMDVTEFACQTFGGGTGDPPNFP